jgi:hypothetical protein
MRLFVYVADVGSTKTPCGIHKTSVRRRTSITKRIFASRILLQPEEWKMRRNYIGSVHVNMVDCLASYDGRIDYSQAYLIQAKDSKRQTEEASWSEGTVGYM